MKLKGSFSPFFIDLITFDITQRCFAPAKLPPSPLHPGRPAAAAAAQSSLPAAAEGAADAPAVNPKPVFCIYDSDDSDYDSISRPGFNLWHVSKKNTNFVQMFQKPLQV